MAKRILRLAAALAATTALAGCAGMTGTERDAQAPVEPRSADVQRGFGPAVRGDNLYGAWDVNDDGLIGRQEWEAAGAGDDFAAWDLNDDLALDEEEFGSAMTDRQRAAADQGSQAAD
jgi:hypothetical protein